jgi:hypothetical protein
MHPAYPSSKRPPSMSIVQSEKGKINATIARGTSKQISRRPERSPARIAVFAVIRNGS